MALGTVATVTLPIGGQPVIFVRWVTPSGAVAVAAHTFSNPAGRTIRIRISAKGPTLTS
jgi:hypothetical protein